jgi:hypothetical protein
VSVLVESVPVLVNAVTKPAPTVVVPEDNLFNRRVSISIIVVVIIAVEMLVAVIELARSVDTVYTAVESVVVNVLATSWGTDKWFVFNVNVLKLRPIVKRSTFNIVGS